MNRFVRLLFIILLPALFSCTEKEPEPQVIPVESVSPNQATASITIGETLQLNASVSPSTATNKEVTWSSSQQSVASVSSAGLVTAVGEGTATITASSGGKQGSCTVSVSKGHVPVAKIELDKTELSLYEGEEGVLTAIVQPEDATEKTITWSSSDASFATVEDGIVKAIQEGQTTITAKAGGKEIHCTVSVLPRIRLNVTELELAIDDTETLTATVAPSSAGKKVSWTSSDDKVATVEDGKVIAMTAGSATITASLDGYKAECTVTVKGLDYQAVSITDLKPVEILPVIGQVTEGDKEVYNHIEHLRLAEATRIRDMMWEYGAGSHSKEEYQRLMGRLNTGMMEEYPLGYDNFEVIGEGKFGGSGDEHAHAEWSILNSLIQHANMRVVYTSGKEWQEKLEDFINTNPKAVVILGCSAYAQTTRKASFLRWAENEPVREMCKSGQLIIFRAGGNVGMINGVFVNNVYHRDIEEDGLGMYSLQSNANGINDSDANIALLATIGTNEKGDADQTGCTYTSSCFPVGFNDRVLFSGRSFPFLHYPSEEVWAEKEGVHAHPTSFTNYLNTAMMSICFQMYAEAKDVFELLDMVRSTCLTDYIRLDGMTQPLQLINPAGLYKKYLTPQNLPTAISTEETLALGKGYYKGVIFCIPGAEVKIDDEWVAFDNKNKSTILALNPMNLEWRLNGDLLRRMGYTSGQTIEGHIITVDDKWGGLRLEVPMSIDIK